MPTSESIEVKKLSLDLKNFRTTRQKKESDAIRAMITIKPDKFYGVMESLLDDGYLLTENIQVLKNVAKLEVKEGNRRIAALKIIHGYYKIDDFVIPDSLKERVKKLEKKWFKDNLSVPCTVYATSEIDKVNRIVKLAHGKGEKASRDAWNSVARARHNKEINHASEPGLEILEKYLKDGQNLSGEQKERFGGNYNITVLEEAMRKLHPRMDCTSIAELVTKYPKIKMRTEFENLMLNIGLEQVGFPAIRSTQNDFGATYGIYPPPDPSGPATGGSAGAGTGRGSGASGGSGTGAGPTGTTGPTSGGPKPKKAHSTTDPQSVLAILKNFIPRGSNREKVVALRDELKNLKIDKNPIAFCFLLRSMFEISANVYSREKHLPLTVTKTTATGPKTKDKTLKELLTGVTNHLTIGNPAMVKVLHGAMTELSQPDRLLSVTSMNQLVHSGSFSVAPADICRLFNKVYPLLEQMN